MKKLIAILLVILNLPIVYGGGSRATLATSSQIITLGKPTTTTSQSTCLWYRIADSGCSTTWHILFSKYVTFPGCEFEFGNRGFPDGQGSRYFARIDDAAGAYYSLNETACTDASMSGWLHMCQTYPAGGALTLYINGVASTPSATFTKTTNSTANLRVGSRAYPGGEGYTSGKFGKASIHSKGLSSNEILELTTGIQNSFGRTTLTSEWTFMETGGTRYDYSGNGFNSTADTSTELTTDGPPIFYPGGQM